MTITAQDRSLYADSRRWAFFPYLPVIIALCGLAVGGLFFLQRADRQGRDTIRKHHLEDVEQALYLARTLHGTYPPYDLPEWCGTLSLPENRAVRDQVESVLRQQNEQYANPDKPFPTDPRFANQPHDYFYWKRSPASFELYAVLEDAPTGERNTLQCPGSQPLYYDYGISSVLREGKPS